MKDKKQRVRETAEHNLWCWVACALSEYASVDALLDNDNGQARLVGGSHFGEGIVQLRDLMVGLSPKRA
jgi:hypothetical protein